MIKNFFPNKILLLKNKLINNLVILLIIVLIFGVSYSLFISPPDYIQGDSVRIMYVHVPSSFIALGAIIESKYKLKLSGFSTLELSKLFIKKSLNLSIFFFSIVNPPAML